MEVKNSHSIDDFFDYVNLILGMIVNLDEKPFFKAKGKRLSSLRFVRNGTKRKISLYGR